MLLEVLVSLGLLTFGFVMVGLQLHAGLDAARTTDVAMRASMLVDNKFDELASGSIRPDRQIEEFKGDFWTIDSLEGGTSVEEKVMTFRRRVGGRYPGFTWRMRFEETDIEDFYMITLEIGYNESAKDEQIDDPDYELDIEDDGTQIVRTAYRLWTPPAPANLQDDFGLDEEDIDLLLAGLGGGLAGEVPGGELPVGDFGMLEEFLNLYLETGSLDFSLLADLPLSDEEFLMLSQFLESLYGRGDVGNLQQQLSQIMRGDWEGLAGGPGAGRGGEGRVGPGGEPPLSRDRASDRPGRGERRDAGEGRGAGSDAGRREGRSEGRGEGGDRQR